jgi:hypothetical protein
MLIILKEVFWDFEDQSWCLSVKMGVFWIICKIRGKLFPLFLNLIIDPHSFNLPDYINHVAL